MNRPKAVPTQVKDIELSGRPRIGAADLKRQFRSVVLTSLCITLSLMGPVANAFLAFKIDRQAS